MSAASLVSQEHESYGVRTFSAKEMAFNILGLVHPLLFSITQVEPIWANLNDGMDRLPDLADIRHFDQVWWRELDQSEKGVAGTPELGRKLPRCGW